MEHTTKEFGKKASIMAKELTFGQMEISMLANGLKEGDMASANKYTLKVRIPTRDNGSRTCTKVMASIRGRMAILMKVNTFRIKSMELVIFRVLTALTTTANSRTALKLVKNSLSFEICSSKYH